MFNTSLIFVLTMSIYTAYIFMPGYIASTVSMGCSTSDKLSQYLFQATVSEKLFFC